MSFGNLFPRLRTLERKVAEIDVRDAEVFGIRARVYSSGNFTHDSSGNWLSIPFDSERWDTDGMHSTSVNNDRLTVVTPGWYIISGSVRFAANAAGTRVLRIMLKATDSIAQQRHASLGVTDAVQMTLTTMYYLAVGDYVTLDGWQDTGGSLVISASANFSPEFSAVRIG
jgi:catechol-2,3-dioxygenase